MMAVGVGVPGYKARPGKVLAARLSREQLLSEEYFGIQSILKRNAKTNSR
jgi:hypothetical protein